MKILPRTTYVNTAYNHPEDKSTLAELARDFRCKNAFFERTDVIGLLLRINKLCMAKVKYFRTNLDKFEPLKYDYKRGFVTVPLWNSDFLRHRASGYILDYRYLQTITVYDDFVALCNELEAFETEKIH